MSYVLREIKSVPTENIFIYYVQRSNYNTRILILPIYICNKLVDVLYVYTLQTRRKIVNIHPRDVMLY